MSQVFSAEGDVIPVTLIVAEPNRVSIRRNEKKDGYGAVQLELRKRKAGEQPVKKTTGTRREFRGAIAEEITEVTVEQFVAGDMVAVSGISKGKGFQGVVKKHHFKGGPASHGHRHVLRRPGSIGSRFPQHTVKGVRMAGRMGGERVTVKNLQVISVDAQKQLLVLKGAVPGKPGTILTIQSVENE